LQKCKKKTINQNNEDQIGKDILSIWIEEWNNFYKRPRQKIINPNNEYQFLKNIIFDKLRFKDEIKNI
jgi:hypothetical protein